MLPVWLHEKIKENTENPLFKDFFQSLKNKIPFSFARSLATAFRKYYLNRQATEGTNSHYQLFFEKVCSHFVSPTNIMQEIRTQARLKDKNLSLFVFTLSGLPLHILSFLSEISEQIPVNFYVLLPTKEYFGDMISDNFIDKYLERNLKIAPSKALLSWENYVFNNRNSLLANLSSSCRSALNFFLDKNLPSTEHFFPPEENSSLGLLKSDIFQLRESTEEAFSQKPSSITIKKALSKTREVQNLFCHISTLIHSGVLPKDIRVLCKNIKEYAPLIRSIFSPHIPLSIRGIISPSGERLQNKIRVISTLLLSKGGLSSLYKLLTHPDIRISESKEDLLKQLSFLNKIFYQVPISERKKGIHLYRLADSIIDNYPFSEATGKTICPEILGEMSLILYRTQSAVEELYTKEENEIKTFLEIIFSLMEDIFLLDDDELFLLEKLKKHLSLYREIRCSLHFFLDFCVHFIEGSQQDTSLPVGKLLVGPIHTLASIPSAHTFVLGASSPTSSEEFSIAPDPTELDEDSNNSDDKNSLFLDIIISTAESLHISFSSSGENPETPLPPVEWIAEASYIRIETIPALPFSKENFQEKKDLHSSFARNFDLARAFYSPKNCVETFIPEKIGDFPSKEKTLSLSISDIIYTLQNPLNAFLDKKAKFSPSIFPTISSPLLYTTSYKDLLKIWTSHISGKTNIEKDEDLLPHKYLSEKLRLELLKHSQLLTSFLQDLQKSKHSSLSSVCFSPLLFQESSKVKFIPEIEWSWNDHKIKLRGSIHGVSSRGLSILSPSIGLKYKKSFPNSIFSDNHPYLYHRIEAKLHLALLSLAKIFSSDHQKKIYEIFCLPNEIFVEHHFLDDFQPEKYLQTVLDTYFSVLEAPYPLYQTLDQTHQIKWSCMSKGDWRRFCVPKNLARDLSPLFWATQNRELFSKELEEQTKNVFDLYNALL